MILNDLEFLKKYIGSDIKSVFHYTSLDGFKSIIENNSIRFTECCYLNDKKEYLDALRILDILVEKYRNDNTLKGRIFKEARNKTTDIYHESKELIFEKNNTVIIEDSRYFVLSATMIQDSLPMWNYYTKDKNIDGCVITLDVDKLTNSFLKYDNIDLLQGKVIYDDEEKIRILEAAADRIINLINNDSKAYELYYKEKMPREEKEDEINIWFITFFEFFETMRLFFKSKAFKYENEYRFLISISKNIKSSYNSIASDYSKINLKFIPNKGIIRCHIDLDFDKMGTITEVMFSPTADLSLSKRSSEDFLNYYGYVDDQNNSVKVSKSDYEIR